MLTNQSLKLASEHRLTMTLALRQALEVLQMPQLELAQWLFSEIEKNPLLELNPLKGGKKFEGEFPAPITLHQHLCQQIRDHFSNKEDRKEAFRLLCLLDEKGFIAEKLEDERILKVLQTFDPPGIFARNIKESLLLQLKAKSLSSSTSYTMIEECYDDLLHGRFSLIKKKLKLSDLKDAIGKLSRLTLRPSSSFQEDQPAQPITADLLFQRIEKGWKVELIEDDLPDFHIQEKYLELDIENEEEKAIHRAFIAQAKWIFRSLNRRRKLLKQIGIILLHKQGQFLNQNAPLQPMNMKELAERLEIHESTLSRALSGKYVATPKGIFPLKSLITSDPEQVSAKVMLEKLIATEDKQNPLTDEKLADALKNKGFKVARRTIAKYRGKLKIGSATQRKNQ